MGSSREFLGNSAAELTEKSAKCSPNSRYIFAFVSSWHPRFQPKCGCESELSFTWYISRFVISLNSHYVSSRCQNFLIFSSLEGSWRAFRIVAKSRYAVELFKWGRFFYIAHFTFVIKIIKMKTLSVFLHHRINDL